MVVGVDVGLHGEADAQGMGAQVGGGVVAADAEIAGTVGVSVSNAIGFTFGLSQSFYDFYSSPSTSYWGSFPASDTSDAVVAFETAHPVGVTCSQAAVRAAGPRARGSAG